MRSVNEEMRTLTKTQEKLEIGSSIGHLTHPIKHFSVNFASRSDAHEPPVPLRESKVDRDSGKRDCNRSKFRVPFALIKCSMVTSPTPESSPDSTLATPRHRTSPEPEGTSLNAQQLLSPFATLFSSLAGSTDPEQEQEEASEQTSIEPNAMQNTPTPSPTTTPTTTHRGGATPSGIRWTGGSQVNAPSNRFASPYAWRPTGEKELFTVYGKATTGLAESKIYDGFGAGKISFGKWAKNIERHLIEFGMDGVFYIGHGNNAKLLTQYHGQFSHSDVQNFVSTYTDALDLENLQWSGIFIRNSISERQQELLDKYQETTGPEMFVRLAVSSYSGHLTLERDAITQMKNAQLQQVPGENVTEFTRLFLELADIPRYGQLGLPSDAALLYVTALSDSTVEKFRGVMNTLYHELCVDVGKYSLAEITSIADQRYHDLVARGLWLDGIDAPTKAVGFAALALTMEQRRNFRKPIVCYHCGQPGHTILKCPYRGKAPPSSTDPSEKPSGPPDAQESSPKKRPWKKQPPASGASEQMQRNERTWYWCAKCKRWNGTHTTAQHKKGLKKANPVGAVACPEVCSEVDSGLVFGL